MAEENVVILLKKKKKKTGNIWNRTHIVNISTLYKMLKTKRLSKQHISNDYNTEYPNPNNRTIH